MMTTSRMDFGDYRLVQAEVDPLVVVLAMLQKEVVALS
jgi:hypothetical protein